MPAVPERGLRGAERLWSGSYQRHDGTRALNFLLAHEGPPFGSYSRSALEAHLASAPPDLPHAPLRALSGRAGSGLSAELRWGWLY